MLWTGRAAGRSILPRFSRWPARRSRKKLERKKEPTVIFRNVVKWKNKNNLYAFAEEYRRICLKQNECNVFTLNVRTHEFESGYHLNKMYESKFLTPTLKALQEKGEWSKEFKAWSFTENLDEAAIDDPTMKKFQIDLCGAYPNSMYYCSLSFIRRGQPMLVPGISLI